MGALRHPDMLTADDASPHLGVVSNNSRPSEYAKADERITLRGGRKIVGGLPHQITKGPDIS